MIKYFDLSTAKRYYHFVIFKFNIGHSLQSYWKDCGVQRSGKDGDYKVENSEFVIEQRSLINEIPYFTGVRDYSVNGDGKAPFRYDLIGIEIKSQNIFVFGFPFKFLAKAIVDSLINKKKYLEKASFFRPNLDKLIKQSVSTTFDSEEFTCHFSSLGLVLTADKLLTSIDLGGDRPMDSPLYKSVFKNVVQENKSHLESCGLKCEVTANDDKSIPKTRGNVHLDHFGNMKVYVHGGGKNVFVIPYILDLLKKQKCSEKTLNNPLLHLRDE